MENVSLRNRKLLRVVVEGAGLFPLAALVQSDGFFASVEDSRNARNTASARRRLVVLLPDVEAFAELLQPEGWCVVAHSPVGPFKAWMPPTE